MIGFRNVAALNDDIHVYQWNPHKKATGVVMILHGMAEHGGRYEQFAKYLNDNGYIVVIHDHPGHGKSCSGTVLGDFGQGGWKKTIAVIDELYQKIKNEHSDLPIIVLGHSMGSLMARYWIQKYSPQIKGLILTGASNASTLEARVFLGLVRLEKILRGGGHKRANWTNRIHFGVYASSFPEKSPFCWLSSDSEQVKLYEEDPKCGVIPTLNLYEGMMKGIIAIHDMESRGKTISFPILIAGGEQDPVGDKGNHLRQLHRIYGKMTEAGAELEIYPGMRHEILNERQRQEVYVKIASWIEQQLDDGEEIVKNLGGVM